MGVNSGSSYIVFPAIVAVSSAVYLADFSPVLRLSIGVALFVVTLFSFTYIYTNLRYSYQMRYVGSTNRKPQEPMEIPYTIPFLGNALEFLAPKPGLFWRRLLAKHPRETGACTLLLGGSHTHIIFDPVAVQALFKAKGPTRGRFNEQLLENALQFPRDDVIKFYGIGEECKFDTRGKPTGAKERQEDLWNEFLVKTEAVNELTKEFTYRLGSDLDSDERLINGKVLEIGILEWVRGHMFNASTIALMGQRILEIYPGFTTDFWGYDRAMLSMFFGLPRIASPQSYEAFETCMKGLTKWRKQCLEECNGAPEDPNSSRSWEPIWGSRVNRARQYFYEERKINDTSKAASDLIFIFGLASNAIPATGWILMHLLDPFGDKTLLPRLMKELKSTVGPDSKPDISKLIALPLLQSIFQEVLRLYTDVLIARDTNEDLVLPFDYGKKSMLLRKGTVIMASSYIGHHDTNVWNDPPANEFYAERFLKHNPETGKDVFSLAGTNGKLFPWGGGKSICPGRIFAKQEVLGAVAMILLKFKFESLGYIDSKGEGVLTFPGLTDAFVGSGIMANDGDVKVCIQRQSTR
jgi:Cytochrome P450